MPATSSAPGSQPESVAEKNAKRQTAQAVKSAAKQTAKAVTTSAAITEAATSSAASIARAASAPAPKGRSRSRSGRRSRPEPALQYKPPKPVAVKVRQDLRTLDTPKAKRAARKPIRVAPRLQAQVKVTPKKTLIAPGVARRAVKSLPPAQRKQAAQKLERRQHPGQKVPKGTHIIAKLSDGETEGLDALTAKERERWKRLNDPDRLERRAEAKAKQWWREAKSVSGLTGPAPQVRFGGEGVAADNHAAVTRDGKRGPKVRFAQDAASVVGPGVTDRRAARQIAFHEFAHVGQKRDDPKGYDPKVDEGRADRFARTVSRKLGHDLDRDVYTDDYEKPRKQSKERDSQKTVLYGQFGKAKKARPKKKTKVEVPSSLPKGEQQFYAELSRKTGLSAKVLAAQGTQEGGADDDYNVLNIGWFDSGPDPVITIDPAWQDPIAAAKLTADFLKGKKYGASEGIQAILSTAGQSDAEQINAIGNSGWATDPNYKAGIQSIYNSLGGTEKVAVSGKATKAPKQLSGKFSGSQTFVRELVGSKVRSDHGVGNEGYQHSATGDHYDPHSYAQDINNPAGNPAEGEPPYNQATLDKIVANLRKRGADVPDLRIGQNWEGVVGGYRVQLLTNEGGEISHIHVGARWEGTPTSATAVSGTAAGVAVGGATSPVVPNPGAPVFSKRSKKRRKRRRSHRQPQIRLRVPAQLDPTDYQIKPSTQSYADYVQAAPARVEL